MKKPLLKTFLQIIKCPKHNYLIQSENVLLSPHVAGWTIESKEKLAQTFVDKIKDNFC